MSQVGEVTTCPLLSRQGHTKWSRKKRYSIIYRNWMVRHAFFRVCLLIVKGINQSVNQSINRVISIRLSVHPCCPFHLYHIHCSLCVTAYHFLLSQVLRSIHSLVSYSYDARNKTDHSHPILILLHPFLSFHPYFS